MSLLCLIPINDISLFTEQLNYQTYLNSLALSTSPISSPTVLPYAFKAADTLAFSVHAENIYENCNLCMRASLPLYLINDFLKETLVKKTRPQLD